MRALRAAVWTAGMLLALHSVSGAGTLILTGPTGNAGTYSSQDLSSLATPGNTVTSGGLTGISLWGLLGGAAGGSVTTNPDGSTTKAYGAITTVNPAGANSNSNYDLRYYVVGTGNNGATSVVSLGQIDPNFAGPGQPKPFIAFQDAGGLLSSPELVVPGGPAGSTIQNLTSLQLTSVPGLPAHTQTPSTSVTLSGNVLNPGIYNESQLPGSFPTAGVTVCTRSGCAAATPQMTTFTGIPLAAFLNANGPNLASQLVVAKATDGYEVVYALSELLMADGTPSLAALLALNAAGSAYPRTILAGDSGFAHGRWVSDLSALEVIDTTTPIPAALPLFASGLSAMGFVTWRRRRKAAVAAA